MDSIQNKNRISESDMYAENDTKDREMIILVFGHNDENFGLEVNDVREIVRVPSSITRVPNAPSHIKGVINLRGIIVPVLDIASIMEGHEHERTTESRIIVVEYTDIQFGILVDEVREVNTIYESQIEQVPEMETSLSPDSVKGVAKVEDGRLIVLLDLPALFQIECLMEERRA